MSSALAPSSLVGARYVIKPLDPVPIEPIETYPYTLSRSVTTVGKEHNIISLPSRSPRLLQLRRLLELTLGSTSREGSGRPEV